MIFTLLTTLLFYTSGAETSDIELYQLQIEDVSLDWSSQTISLDKQTLILTKHFQTYESKYQIELSLLDIQKNELIKSVFVGDQTRANYHPKIIIMNKYIYIIFVNQDLSIVKLVLKKYDLNLVEQQIEHTLGDSLENAKFDKKQQFIQLTQLNSTAFSIIWKSRGQSVNQYQWNYIKYNTLSDKSSQVQSLQDSSYISIAQNRLGIIGIVQPYKQFLQITKIENEKITDVFQTSSQQYPFYDDLSNSNIFSLPDGEFIIYIKQTYREDSYVKRFDRQLQEKSEFQVQQISNRCFSQIQQVIYQNQYQLFTMTLGYEGICFYQYDFSNQTFSLIQERKVMKSGPYWNQIYCQRIDEIDFHKFQLIWVSFQNFKYELNAIQLDMNIKLNECKQNCKLCDPLFKCLTCADGYTLISVKNECVPKCPDNCDYCNDPSFCIKCKQGFQYSFENLCITPQQNMSELRISDEQVQKGKFRISTRDNEILILYSLWEDLKEKQLVLRKLNSKGVLIKQITIDCQPNEILDFDLSSAVDVQYFHVLVKRLTVDSIVQIIDYQYDYVTMEVTNERFLDVKSPISRGKDQIRIAQLKNQDVFYFYQSFDEYYQYYQIYYLRIDDQGTYYNNLLMQNYYKIQQIDISVIQNIIYIKINQKENNQYMYIQERTFYYLNDYEYKNIAESKSIQLEYDKFQNEQLFMTFTQSQSTNKLLITQSTRTIKSFLSSQFGQQFVLIVWIGYSNVELENQVNQIYIQNVNLMTQELTNFKGLICSNNCASCNDQGECLECKNTKYELQNNQCVLTCENNCELCEVENQCLQCASGFYINENLLCDQTQQQDVFQQDNVILSNIISQDDSIFQVSLKKNNLRYDVVFEEYNRQGQSKSGEIKISNDSEIVLFIRPKVLKINNQIVIQYIKKNFYKENIAQFVILNDQYLQINKFSPIGEIFGNENIIDFITYDDEKLDIVFVQYINSYWDGRNIYLKYVQYSMGIQGNPQVLKESTRWLAKIDKKYEIRDIQIMRNQFLQKLTVSYTFIEDNIESIKSVSITESQDYIFLDSSEKFIYYLNNYKLWIVSQEKLNSNLIKLKFYNQNQQIIQEHTIESQNQLSSFQIQSQSKFIYFIYTEQSTTNNNMNIQVIKYSLNGDKLNQRQIYHNELMIQDLQTSVSVDMLYLIWSSFQNNRTFKVRLNSELNTIPFVVEQLCNMNCEICDSNLICKQCSSDYYYHDNFNKCEPICAQNCQSCRQPYTCDYCNGNSKFIDQKCREISQFNLETSICQDSCYGVPSMITFSDESIVFSYQKYENQVYKININIKNQPQNTIILDQNLVIQDQEIAYHYLYLYDENSIALIWSSGNCQIQCRLMFQLFQKDWQVITNPQELRIMKLKVKNFNFQIEKFNNNLLFLWTELDQNDKSQTILGEYNLNNGFSLKFNINENENDECSEAKLIIQSGYYQIIYIKNNLIINALTVDGSSKNYREIYTSNRPITSLAVQNSNYYGIGLVWIENEQMGLYLQNNYIYFQWFDFSLNARGNYYTLYQSFYQITHLSVSQQQNDPYAFLTFLVQEFNGQYRLRYKYISFQENRELALEEFQFGNILSQYNFEYGYRIYKIQQIYKILFSGFIGSSQQLFYFNVNLNQAPQDNCFQKNNKFECIWCKQGYYLFENSCELQLPQHCADGNNGICEVCDEGYFLTIDNVCSLKDLRYKEMRMNTYILQSKQRITTFKNGDYVTVWQRQYYENEGTGVFMTMFNAHGKKILEEKRISLSSAGIQIFPDVQALDNDQFCAVWIEGDLKVQAKIKLQRFTRDFVRIGDEITVKENVQLKHSQRFDTPLMIQSIINGYVIVWTQNHLEQNRMIEKLHVAFYDFSDTQQGSYVLNNQESIRNSEPVVASNDQIIVIVWQSDFGIIASKFSLNYIYITQQTLSQNGQAPTISVLSDNKFIIAWRETFINSNDIMSDNIMFRKYSSDLNYYEFSNQIMIQDHNLNNPDVIPISNGFAIIFENRHALMSEVRNLKMQLFNFDGYQITHIIDVYNEYNQYPHHPLLTQLPQGEFLASWTLSRLEETSFNDDLYMKRYNSNGIQLPMDTIVCPQNCQQCNENDICLVCMNDFVLNSNNCHKSIPHCITYSTDSIELICQTCDTEYQLTNNICYKEITQQQLSVEFVNEITSQFSMIKLKNSDILFIWQNNMRFVSQRFNSQGKYYDLPKELNLIEQMNRQQFDACEFDDNFFVVAYLMGFQRINIAIFDDSQTILIQRDIGLKNQQYWGDKLMTFVLKKLGNNQIAVVYSELEDQLFERVSLKMEIFKIIKQNDYFSIDHQQSITIFSQYAYQQLQSIDVEIVDKHITIWIENVGKSEIRYTYKIYDFFGNLLKKIIKKNDDTQIEFTIMQLQDGSIIEVWTEIIYSKYEVFYVVKKDDQNIFEPKKLSSSKEQYKIDLKTYILSDSLVVIWREGSFQTDITANTIYKAVLISKQNYQQVTNEIQLNSDTVVKKGLVNFLRLIELPNQDIVIGWISYNFLVEYHVITAIKLNKEGQILKFSDKRCPLGCQECTNEDKCIKCYNHEKYFLDGFGNCITKLERCYNYETSCQNCLDGYYQNRYLQCNEIKQNVEIDVMELNSFSERIHRFASYKNGTLVVAQKGSDRSLGIRVFDQEATLVRDYFVIIEMPQDPQIGSDYYITHLQISIDDQDVLTFCYLITTQLWHPYVTLYAIEQYDNQLNRIGDVKLVPLYIYSFFTTLNIKNLENNQLGIAIKADQGVIFHLYSFDQKEIIGNIIIQNSDKFEFISNGEYIYYGYLKNDCDFNYKACTVIKVFDKKLRFIKDLIINDATYVKMTINNKKQLVVLTQNQINVIDNVSLFTASSINTQSTVPIKIFVNSNNELVIFCFDYREVITLLLTYYGFDGQQKSETQVNMKKIDEQISSLFMLQNSDIIILFSRQSQVQSFITNLKLARFDEFGKSLSTTQIICPQNCELCFQTTTCNICKPGYNRNQQTLLCEKICTIEGCKSCEQSDCDVCKDGMFLTLNKFCVALVQDPSMDEIFRYKVPFNYVSQLKKKILKFTNNEFALIYVSQGYLKMTRFNAQGQELMFSELIFNEVVTDFDAAIVNNQIYIVIVTNFEMFTYKLYTFVETAQQFNLMFTNQVSQSIKSINIKSFKQSYVILVSFQESFSFNYWQYMQCITQSLYFYNELHQIVDSKINFNIPPDFKSEDCNMDKISNLYIYEDILYLINTKQTSVRIIALNSLGQSYGENTLDIPNIEQIEFTIDNEQIVILTKETGTQIWNFRIFNTQYQLLMCQDTYIKGDLSVSMVTTQTSIIIAWSETQLQTVVQYVVMNRETYGTRSTYINGVYSQMPLLTELDNQIVCLVWSVYTNDNAWTLQYSLLDKTGEYIALTHIICPQNCQSCTDSSTCQQCQDGYNLINYYKDNKSFFSSCEKKCDPYCIRCDYGRCYQCQKNYYISKDEICVLNEFENKAIQLNEFTEFSQITPDAAKFKDGSILIAWTSNNEDEDSWGVFAQLLNNQGQKIGNNFRVSQSVFGAQHNPQVAVLEDDTAIITFIEGNPQSEAILKGIRYNNRLETIGNEQLFATFSLKQFQLNYNFINRVVSLKNGGFVIIWISNTQINLQFYDSASNLVIQTQILDIIESRNLEVAATTTDLAIIYRKNAEKQFVCIFNQDGVMLLNQELQEWGQNYVKLISISNYFALASILQILDQQQIKMQLYNNQFSPQGNPIIVASNSFQQQSKYVRFYNIDFFSLHDGALLILQEISNSEYYRQFYIDINWQVTELLTFGFNFQYQYYFYISNFMKIKIIPHINTDQYFLYWNGAQQNYDLVDNRMINFNIYIQRLSKQQEFLVPIDQIACSQNCKSCETSNTCSQCLNQYLVQDHYCIPQCESNCQKCLIPKICEICFDGYYQKVSGKCSPIPVNYQEPQILMDYTIQSNLLDLEVLPNGQIFIFHQQTLFDQQKEIFSLSVYQNNELIKQISVQTNTLTTYYQRVNPYYIDENLYLIFQMYDGYKIIKFNGQQEEVLNTLLQIESIDSNIQIYTSNLIPLSNNQYSLIYHKMNEGIHRIIYDEAFIVISKELVLEIQDFIHGWSRNKKQLLIHSLQDRWIITNSQDIQLNKQICLNSALFQYCSYDIYDLSNGNKVQLISGSQYVNYNAFSNYEANYQVFYRILDNQNVPLTAEALVSENKITQQYFVDLFVFEDSFTIIFEKADNFYGDNQVYSQRFENTGMKIGEPQLIIISRNWQRRYYKQTQNGYIIFQENRIYSTSPEDVQPPINIIYKQYDQQGNAQVWITNKNCIANCDKCINKYYCEQCSDNYKLDSNNKCKLTCQSNCNQCSTFTTCDSCDVGYKLVSGSCNKIVCVDNCASCLEDTTQTSTICSQCNDNYYLSSDSRQCVPQCPSNCSQCTVPLECGTCAFGYVITSEKKCQQENSSILDQIKNTTVGTPLMATFPDGSYILMWYQNGDNAGVYFQLYSADNVKVGDPMKVTGNTRRLLNQQSIVQNYFADIISIDYEFYVTWMDASAQATDVKLKKFASDGTAQSEDLLLGTHQKTDLQEIKIPCQIKKTSNNSLLIAYMAKNDNQSNDFSMFISSYDSFMNSKAQPQEIKKVNQLAAPSIVLDENGIISLTYQSDGYVFVQQITEDGNLIDTPKAIADSNSINLRVTNLANGIMVFLWENKNLQLSQPQFILNYQLISKDLKTRSEVKSVGDIQIASLTPDIQSFNEGFIIAWKITDSNYKSIGLEFQIFDSMGISNTQPIEVQIEGIYPQTPRIQIINENQFAVTWTAKNVDSDGTILGDGIFMQKYNKYGTLITDSSSSTDLCSYQCQSCQSPLVCLKCQYGFYLNQNNQCIMDCGTFCDSCEIPWTCQVCKNGYELNNNEACIETECSEGYQRNTNTKLCEPKCPDECNECSVPNICVTCKSGYSLSDSSCISSTVNMELDDQSTIMAIVIIILAAAFISVSACSITLYCKYKKLLKEPSYCQVHPAQDINKSVSNISCNVSVIRLRQNE